MNIAIVDDQIIDIKLLSKYLSSFAEEKGLPAPDIFTFNSADVFLNNFTEGSYNLIFLDINMSGMNGIDLAREIRKTDTQCKIIFATSSNEYATESYEVGASFYLLKPYTFESFSKILQLVIPRDILNRQAILLPDGQKFIPSSIIYTEYYNHKITIYLKYNEILYSRLSQADFEDLVKDYNYLVSINRGIMINLKEMKKYNDSNAIMSNGSSLPISRGKEKALKQAVENYKLNQLS